MAAGLTAVAGVREQQRLLRPVADAYRRGGAQFVRRALLAQLSLGLVGGLVGALLTLLYAEQLSVGDLVIITLFSWLIYVVDAAFAAGPIRRGLEPFERWCVARD